MVTDIQMNEWFYKLFREKAIYVWGMNGDIIDAETINKAYKNCHNPNYDLKYYQSKERGISVQIAPVLSAR